MKDFRYYIARRYLFSRKRLSVINLITGISIGLLTIGAMLLVVVLSVMNGFSEVVQNLMLGLDPHVRIVSNEGRSMNASDSVLTIAKASPHVAHAAPYVEGKVLLMMDTSNDLNQVVIVRGVEPESIGGVSRVVEETSLGAFSLERQNGQPGIVVGAAIAHANGLMVAMREEDEGGVLKSLEYGGSEVRLLSAPAIERMLTQFFGASPLSTFEVRGLFELEPKYDNSHVFISLQEAQRLFRMGKEISGIELRLHDVDQAGEVKEALQAQLGTGTYEVKTWYDLKKQLYDVMQLEKWGASAIIALIVLVAAFSIVGSLTMVVIEKRRDVGVLQAMGATRQDIRRIFMLEGGFIGVIGTVSGLALGLLICFVQDTFELVPLMGAESFILNAYPISVQPFDIVVIVVISLGLSLGGAIYPALRASNIEPARAVQVD